MVAARLNCQSAMVGTSRWLAARLGCQSAMVETGRSLAARLGCQSAMVGTSKWLAARLGCQSAMVGTRWANPCPGCMGRLRKHYSHFVGGSFLAGKAVWAMSGCLTTKSADY